MDWQTFLLSMLAAAIVFLCCFALFAANVMGGGDAKLLTATACWYGFNLSLLEFLLGTAFLGGSSDNRHPDSTLALAANNCDRDADTRFVACCEKRFLTVLGLPSRADDVR